MAATGLYPLLFAPVYKDYPWGGGRIPVVFRRAARPGTSAESWEMAENNARMDAALRTQLFEESRAWRGVRLPNDSQGAANYIWWMLSAGVLARMLVGNRVFKTRDEQPETRGSDGVAEFWDLATGV